MHGTGAVVAAAQVRLAREAVRITPPRAADAPAEPVVQLVREDGVIRAIEIVCGCGERVRVVCEYAG